MTDTGGERRRRGEAGRWETAWWQCVGSKGRRRQGGKEPCGGSAKAAREGGSGEAGNCEVIARGR